MQSTPRGIPGEWPKSCAQVAEPPPRKVRLDWLRWMHPRACNCKTGGQSQPETRSLLACVRQGLNRHGAAADRTHLCRKIREDFLWQEDRIEGLALLGKVPQCGPGAAQDHALAAALRGHHLHGVLRQARDLDLGLHEAGEGLRCLGVGAEHAGRLAVPHLRAHERCPRIPCHLLEEVVVAAGSRSWHDDLANVDVQVVVVQPQGLEESRGERRQRRASLDGDARGLARQGAALQGTLDAQHLQRPGELSHEDRERVVPRPEALGALLREWLAVAVEPEANLLVLGLLAHILAEEAGAPTGRRRNALQDRGRPGVALDDEETAALLLAEEIECILAGQTVLRDKPCNGLLDVFWHRHAVEEEQVALRAVAALEGDAAVDAHKPGGVLHAADEALPLPGVGRRGLHARRAAAALGHDLDLLLAIDAGLDALHDDIHVAEGHGAVVETRPACDHTVLRHRHTTLLAHLREESLVVQAGHHVQALAQELDVRQAPGEPVLGDADEEGLVDRRHRQDHVDLLPEDERLQVLHPLRDLLRVQRLQRLSRVTAHGDGARTHGLVVGDHHPAADLLQGADGMQGLGLPASRDQDGLAGVRSVWPAAEEGLNKLQNAVRDHAGVPDAVGQDTEKPAEETGRKHALHLAPRSDGLD
mmetsp:Transcript_9755/g.29195  ORF Transcript_9755/g.29195 Transcript_9755/m.29195 type:complete len:647 (+) Transcript_9755:374-2314(+)